MCPPLRFLSENLRFFEKHNKLSYLILALVFTSSLPLFAQAPIYLGKSEEVIAEFRTKAILKTAKHQKNDNKIIHRIPGRSHLTLTINTSKAEGNEQVFIGDIANHKGSTFFIRETPSGITGNIILMDEKKAYTYISNKGATYLEEIDIGKLVCLEDTKELHRPSLSENLNTLAISVPSLQSLPGASAVVLLDFDGQYVVNSYWNGGNPINAAPASLSENEIIGVWKLISEDFRPFDLNITTSESVYLSAPANKRMRVIFTPTKSWYGDYGGTALQKSFTWGNDTPCWAFNSSIKGAGEVASHVIGRTLGVTHKGRTSPPESFYYGQNSWAPIMGLGYDKPIVQWSKGEYLNASNTQDELFVITNQNGFGYRADDHSNSTTNATPIVRDADGYIAASLNKGIITTREDVDVFTFTSLGSFIILTANPHPDYPNLDISLTLKNSSGATILIKDSSALSASIKQFLPAGIYYLFIDGVKGDFGADSDYGSLGEYSISGYMGKGNLKPSISLTVQETYYERIAPTAIQLTATASDLDGAISKVEFFNGTIKLGEDLSSPYEYTWNNVQAGTYNVTAKATDNLGASATSSIGIVSVLSVPSPWKNQDIGSPSLTGSASYNNEIFTLKSAGYDFWKAPDDFHFVYRPLSGNGAIVAKVASIGNTNGSALAGIMIRESLSVSSSFVATVVNPTTTLSMSRQGINTPLYKSQSGTAPRWVKLIRMGNTFTSYYSTDGVSWTSIESVTVTMGSNVYVGLALTSHNTTLINTATFSNVQISTPSSNQSPIVSINSPTPNALFKAAASITIAAQATDVDGTISKVEFFNETTKLGEDLSSPYSFSWTTPPSNNTTLNIVVKATDNFGAVTVSSVRVSIFTTVAPYYPTGIIDPQNLTYVNGMWYFTSNHYQNCRSFDEGGSGCITMEDGYQFWRTDGTPGGTIKLFDDVVTGEIEEGYFNPYPPIDFIAVGNSLYFIGRSYYYFQLLKIDNSTTQYTVLKNFDYHEYYSYNFTSLNGTLFFTALSFIEDEDESGLELWKSNGTPQSTIVVKDINPGYMGSDPQNLRVENNLLYFSANDGMGRRLWKSDGTEAGTVKVITLPQAPSISWIEVLSRTATQLLINTSEDCGNTNFYVIERGLNASGPFLPIDSLTVQCDNYSSYLYFKDNYLLPNTTYYYRVKAVNLQGSSPNPLIVSVKTMEDVTSPINATAQWNKRFGGTQDETLQSTIRTPDGGYLLAGSSRSGLDGDKSEASRGGLDFWILKLGADGTKFWDKRFGGASYDGLHAAIQTTDGGYLLGGTSSSVISGDKSEGNRGAGDYWIIKLSSSGVKEWDKTFGGSALDELRSVIQTSDGGYLIGGYSLSSISGDKTEGSRGESDYWVVKVTSSGLKQWDKRFGGTYADELSTMIQTSDGNYLIGGTTRSGFSGDVSQNTRDEGQGDYWIVKLNTSGIKLWDKRYGGNRVDQLKTIIQTSDSNLLLGGSSTSSKSGEKSESSDYSNQYHFCYWVLKVSTIGEMIWDRTFQSLGEGNYLPAETHSYLISLIQTPDGGFLVGGSSQMEKNKYKSEGSRGLHTGGYWDNQTVYSFDYWMIKVNSYGIREWDKTYGGFGEDNLGGALYNSDGSLLLAGSSTSGADGDKTDLSRGKTDYWIVQTKPSIQSPITCTASGTILREVWNTITGTAVSTIPVSTTPNTTGQLPLFESPTNAGDNYGQRIRGYICVPQTGNYTFWIAGDDNCELWLSTTDQALSKVKIAHITGTTALAGVREWNKYTTQQSVPIALQAGKRYYIEALHKESTGADNLAVGWQLPNGMLERPIPGNRLSPVTLVVNQAPIVSLTAPANNSSFVAPASITLTASASDGDGSIAKVEFYRGTTKLGEDLVTPYSYSWQSVPAGSYGLTAKAIDNLGKVTTSSTINISVQAPCTASGTILREVWNNVLGVEVSTIPLTTMPSATSQLTSFEAPTNAGTSYGQRIRGYICVPLTGSYTFYIAGDDNCELWLSTTDLPASKVRIAHISGINAWAAVRQWTKYTTQKSVAISLQAGRRYYVEALHKENSGGDNLAVGWQLAGATTIDVIPGSVLSPFVQTIATARLNQEPFIKQSGPLLQVFPNPSTGELLEIQITGLQPNEEANITLYDGLGSQVEKYVVKATELGQVSKRLIFSPSLSSGMYTISLQTRKEYVWQKVVVSK